MRIFWIGGLPETTPITPYIPVAELIDERLERLARRLRVKIVQRFRDRCNCLVQERQRPTVDLRTFFGRHLSTQVHVVETCVENEKTVGIPKRIDK